MQAERQKNKKITQQKSASNESLLTDFSIGSGIIHRRVGIYPRPNPATVIIPSPCHMAFISFAGLGRG